MLLSFRFKILILFAFVIISSFIFYLLSNQQPFQVLYDNGLDKILNYIIKSETPERVKELVTELDVYYWNIIVASMQKLLITDVTIIRLITRLAHYCI